MSERDQVLDALSKPAVLAEIDQQIEAAVDSRERDLMEQLHSLGYPITVSDDGYAIGGVLLA